MIDKESSRYVYLEMKEETSPEQLSRHLAESGYIVTAGRTMAGLEEGYAVTETMAAGLWEQESGYAHCEGHCGARRPHRPWTDLAEQQRQKFVKRLTQFLDQCRQEELLLDTLLEDDPEFGDVALERCLPGGDDSDEDED